MATLNARNARGRARAARKLVGGGGPAVPTAMGRWRRSLS
jgi:hypothetical protein